MDETLKQYITVGLVLIVGLLIFLYSIYRIIRAVLKGKVFSVEISIFIIIISLLLLNKYKIVENLDGMINNVHHTKKFYEKSDLHEKLKFVIDLHADSILWTKRGGFMNRIKYGHVDFPRLIEANVALQVLATVSHVPKDFINNSSNSTDLMPFKQFFK